MPIYRYMMKIAATTLMIYSHSRYVYHDGTHKGQPVNNIRVFNALCEKHFFQVNDRIKNNTDQRQAEKNSSHCVEQGMAFNKQFHTYNASECKLKHGSIQSCWLIRAYKWLNTLYSHYRYRVGWVYWVGYIQYWPHETCWFNITLRTDLSKLNTETYSKKYAFCIVSAVRK